MSKGRNQILYRHRQIVLFGGRHHRQRCLTSARSWRRLRSCRSLASLIKHSLGVIAHYKKERKKKTAQPSCSLTSARIRHRCRCGGISSQQTGSREPGQPPSPRELITNPHPPYNRSVGTLPPRGDGDVLQGRAGGVVPVDARARGTVPARFSCLPPVNASTCPGDGSLLRGLGAGGSSSAVPVPPREWMIAKCMISAWRS